MKHLTLALLLLFPVAIHASPVESVRRTIVLFGEVRNTTAEASAKMRLELTIQGEKVTGVLTTQGALSGSGRVEGKLRGGWCELAGELVEGYRIQMRGGLNARDYRGTYFVGMAGSPVQYGKFQLALQAAPATP